MADVEIKPQVYKDPRPKEYFDQFHARVRDHEPEPIYEGVRVATVLNALISFRARGFGSENVPNGPAHPRAQPCLVHGSLLHRRVHPPAGAVHG